MIMLGFATIQAILSSFLVVSILKILSGRAAPLRPGGKSLYFLLRTDNPADFNFAFWENMTETLRLFWPSGHTAAVTAFVAAICAFYNEKIWIFVIGYIIVIITGLSMIDGDYHWTSDVIAGALIGQAIGWCIGKYFNNKQQEIDIIKNT